jgi:hypothetical protein
MINQAAIRYQINDRDEITYVDRSWDSFAEANDGADIVGIHVLGRSLWTFISDRATRQLYQQIVARVRQGHPMRFTLRCDSPSCKRHLEMTIQATGGDSIEFATQVLKMEHRPALALLARGTLRSNQFLRACAWCNRIEVGSGGWTEVEDAVKRLNLFEVGRLPQLTHGMCTDCHAKMTGSMDDLMARA